MIKFFINLLARAFLIGALVFFLGILFFIFKADSENAFVCVLLGWTSYFLGWGARNYANLLKNR